MVEGAIVYLKYFQKSKRALRLNREASTSSVNIDSREGHTLQNLIENLLRSFNSNRKCELTNIPDRPVYDAEVMAQQFPWPNKK